MTKTAQFQSKKISYSITGTHENTLVLLHGFPMDKRVWDSWIPLLSKNFKVIAIDHAGFGSTDIMADEHSMKLMAEVVQTVLEHEQITKAILIGHSMGGYVTLEFAATFAPLLAGIVLFHSHALGDDDQAKLNRDKAIETVKQDKTVFVSNFISGLFHPRFAQENPSVVEQFTDIAASQSEDAVIAALKGMKGRQNHLNTLQTVDIPVLFILGKHDSRMPYTNLLAQLALPKHAELLLLEDAGHMGFVETPNITRKAVETFATRCF